ncbi:hypothetical protein vB_PsyM_KIL2_0011 [Pseudomonas phage vB_PsyM_KIL2]|uniref:Uncharacterized protein n=1 Tax=Pseudomonas phage vB_PsyM_KIL2 TaxID=1777066 RepID=A0A142IDW7_9CAUD|nr:hypothetical protein vB_PsyM_KIL2_0011 [Pseudomonas phage vB_PsyM_KIL2]
MKSLDDKHLEQLKKLLAETQDLVLESIHVEFDASGGMHVAARENGVVRQIEIKGTLKDENT